MHVHAAVIGMCMHCYACACSDRRVHAVIGVWEPGILLVHTLRGMECVYHSRASCRAVSLVCHANGHTPHVCGAAQVAQQICFADRVLLNKSDLVSPSELARTRARVEGLNAAAKLFETTRGKGVELRELIGIHAFDPSRHQERHRGFDPPP